MQRLIRYILIVMMGCTFLLPASAAKLTAELTGSKINVSIDGKFFTSYIFSEDEKYPFFYPVNGPVTVVL